MELTHFKADQARELAENYHKECCENFLRMGIAREVINAVVDEIKNAAQKGENSISLKLSDEKLKSLGNNPYLAKYFRDLGYSFIYYDKNFVISWQ